MEILLVDDGATDETPGICDRLAREDSRIRVFHRENGGLAAARNTGLENARGKYVCFVDSDDYLLPGALDALWEIARTQGPDLIRYGFEKISPDGRREQWCFPDEPGLYAGEGLEGLRLDAICYGAVLDYTKPRMQSACNLLCRRALLEAHSIAFVSEREILNEDYLFLLQVMYVARTVFLLSQPLYGYETRGGSLSTAPRPDMWQRKQRLFERYRELLPDTGETGIRLKNFYIDCVYSCFVEVCLTAKSTREAVRRIRPLLRDPLLHRYLRENRSRIRSGKTGCICLLMALRASGAMYRLYCLRKS